MRIVSYLLLFLSLATAVAWVIVNQEEIRSSLHEYVENGDFLTLETRFSREHILAQHRKAYPQAKISTPRLQFHPYLLMEVKYLNAFHKTEEGLLLWSLTEGEMILDTETWESTHGFADCILSGANHQDFQLLTALGRHSGGWATLQQLKQDLGIEEAQLTKWIKSVEKKHLAIHHSNIVQLHFSNPKFWVDPVTKVAQKFATKPLQHAQRLPKRFSRKQIQKAAEAAFGQHFAVRRTCEIFLPIYHVEGQNPDGTTRSVQWNALTGQRQWGDA